MDILNMKIYAYESLRTGHTKSDLKDNLKNTRLYADYKDLVNILRKEFVYIPDDDAILTYEHIENNMLFNPDSPIQVDIITSARENMFYKLDKIIEQNEKLPFIISGAASTASNIRSKRGFHTVLIINSLRAFGNIESIKKYYKIFRRNKIGILFPDYTRESSLSEYSTFGFDFQPRQQSEYDRAFDLVYRLEEEDLPDRRGRIANDYSMAFRVAFWLYELFRISEKTAIAMSGYSKNGFHSKAGNYEQTVNYKEELEKFEKNYNISTLVKRNRPVPNNFDRLIHWCEKKNSLELACIHCKVPMIFPIDYKRLMLKAKGGRKEIMRCTQLYDNVLTDSFNDWVASGKPNTEFYNQCNDIVQYLDEIR